MITQEGCVFRVIAALMSRTFSEIDLRDDLNQIPKLNRSTSSSKCPILMTRQPELLSKGSESLSRSSSAIHLIAFEVLLSSSVQERAILCLDFHS